MHWLRDATIAIDFDHTLVNGDKRIEGAREAINLLREHGARIIIHSCNDTDWIEKVMNDQDLRYDRIWTKPGKPIADIYIDDRGFRFSGDWSKDVKEIIELLKNN